MFDEHVFLFVLSKIGISYKVKKAPCRVLFSQNDYLKKGGELIILIISPSIMKKNLISSISTDVSLFMVI